MRELLSNTEMRYVHQTVLYNKSRKEIANCFNRSFDTVASQLKNIYRKLGINSLTELCQKYYAEEFNLSEQIAAKKREIGAIGLSILMLAYIALDDQEILRLRSYRRELETEQTLLLTPIEGV